MIIVTLAQCGDIQTNPGPVNLMDKKKRKYNIRYPCVRCQLGIRVRPVKCFNCHSLTHSKCIEGLTNELYDRFRNNNEEIVFKCNYCVHTNVPMNIRKALTPLPILYSVTGTAAAEVAAVMPGPEGPLRTNSNQNNISTTNSAGTGGTNPDDTRSVHQGEYSASLNTNTHTHRRKLM